MTDIGPHLLGRIPSPPDARDWKLEDFQVDDATLVAQAEAELKQTTVGYINRYWKTPPGSTHWAKGLAFLAQIAPPAPTPPPAPSGDIVWQNPEAVLDQGNFGTCVGNGCAQWGNTLPVDDKFTEGMGQSALNKGPYARAIYYEATVLDGAPDNPDAAGGGQQGATVRSGVKALKNRARLSAYASASTKDAIISFLKSDGALIVGTDWMNDMFSPDASGYVKPTGGVAGGHCYLLIGYLESEDAFYFLNSWGAGWGLSGYFKMKTADFMTLLANGGEAWAALELVA